MARPAKKDVNKDKFIFENENGQKFVVNKGTEHHFLKLVKKGELKLVQKPQVEDIQVQEPQVEDTQEV